MYFPFLRGKQNELTAIVELSSLITSSQKITPIIEPVNLNSTTRRIIPSLNESRVPLIFIINPMVGETVEEGLDFYSSLLSEISNKDLFTLGYYITESTTLSEVESVINEFNDFSFALIHVTNSRVRNELAAIGNEVKYHVFIDGKVGSAYKNVFRSKKRVLISDSFVSQSRNVDYPPDEYFSDLFKTYETDYYGFGDYQIVGANTGGGGPAHAVALHLTYLKEPNGEEIWVKHLVSDDTETPANVQGKYFQALRKLISFADTYTNTPETEGIRDYRNNFNDGNYHGLGFPKKLSIKHHIELMSQLL